MQPELVFAAVAGLRCDCWTLPILPVFVVLLVAFAAVAGLLVLVLDPDNLVAAYLALAATVAGTAIVQQGERCSLSTVLGIHHK